MSMTKISKTISLVLRHKPDAVGVTLDEHGWADTKALINGLSKRYPGFDMDILEQIVREDEKQRYSFNDDKTKIRANQGHSIPVDLELDPVEPPEYLYHGSATKYFKDIWNGGLVAKSRQYVHLSSDIGTAEAVGARHGVPVVYRVSAGEMYKQGFIFRKSKNGVWLTERVPREFLEEVRAWE